MIEVKGTTIYTGNSVNEALIKATNLCLQVHGKAEICFDVMGRTKHELLSHELYSKLDQEKYEAEITYNYGCIFKKKEDK